MCEARSRQRAAGRSEPCFSTGWRRQRKSNKLPRITLLFPKTRWAPGPRPPARCVTDGRPPMEDSSHTPFSPRFPSPRKMIDNGRRGENGWVLQVGPCAVLPKVDVVSAGIGRVWPALGMAPARFAWKGNHRRKGKRLGQWDGPPFSLSLSLSVPRVSLWWHNAFPSL